MKQTKEEGDGEASRQREEGEADKGKRVKQTKEEGEADKGKGEVDKGRG